MNTLLLLLTPLVVWAAWPIATTLRNRILLVAAITFFPVASWLVVVPLGLRKRYRDSRTAATFTSAAQEIDHNRDVTYWRGLLETGTPAERAAAKDLLAHWGEPEEHPPAVVGQPADFDHLH